jgi:hypothetical protein
MWASVAVNWCKMHTLNFKKLIFCFQNFKLLSQIKANPVNYCDFFKGRDFYYGQPL